MLKFQDDEKNQILKENIAKSEAFFIEHLNGKDFLGGDSPMMLDIHCFVMVERLCLLENSVWHEGWAKLDVKATCPTICAYVERFRKHPAFANHVAIPEAFHGQIKLQDANPVGVKKQLSIDILPR